MIYRSDIDTGATSIVGAENSNNRVFGSGLTIGPDSTLYTSTDSRYTIDAVNPVTGAASTFYSFTNHGECDDQILSMTADETNLYVTRTTVGCFGDPRDLTVYAINLSTKTVTASYPIDTNGGDDDYTSPEAIASVGDSIYVGYHGLDSFSHPIPWTLLRVPKNGDPIQSVAGGALNGDADGVGAAAGFSSIDGIASDGENLFVTESSGRIVEITKAPPPATGGDSNGQGPTLPNEMINGNLSELSTQCSCGDPVNTATGALWEQATDLAVPGRGVPLTLERTYDSQQAASDGPLGHGWTLSYVRTSRSTPSTAQAPSPAPQRSTSTRKTPRTWSSPKTPTAPTAPPAG